MSVFPDSELIVEPFNLVVPPTLTTNFPVDFIYELCVDSLLLSLYECPYSPEIPTLPPTDVTLYPIYPL